MLFRCGKWGNKNTHCDYGHMHVYREQEFEFNLVVLGPRNIVLPFTTSDVSVYNSFWNFITREMETRCPVQ